MKIDLTYKIRKETVNHLIASGEYAEIDVALLKKGHVGTHLDIMNCESIPLDYCHSNGRIFSVSKIRNRDIELSDLSPKVQIQEGDFVLFHTGFIDEQEYGTKEYFRNHPQLSFQLIDYLRSKKIRFIGLDAAGVRRGSEHRTADETCARDGVFIIENLVNLGKLFEHATQAQALHIHCLWWEMEKATGIPCRVVADVETLPTLRAYPGA